MNRPQAKRHHYIPETVLKHFEDPAGYLWFLKRGDRKMLSAVPTTRKNLFVEGYLYSKVNPDGSKDNRLESFFAEMEGDGGPFIERLADIVRKGQTPRLDEGAWNFWHSFVYYQLKRTPGYTRAIADRMGMQEIARKGAEHVRAIESAYGITDGHDDLEDRLYKNAVVFAQSLPPGERVRDAFDMLGLAIYYIADQSKSFLVGDVPGATATVLSQHSPHLLFIPITHDIAVGYLRSPRTVEVYTVNREAVRRMNVATAERSAMVAGRSKRLVESIVKDSRYIGVVLNDGEGPIELSDLLQEAHRNDEE